MTNSSISMKYRVTLILVGFFLFQGFLITGYAQQSQQELENKRKQLESEIAYTNQLLSEVRSSRESSLKQLKLIEVKIDKRNNLLANYKLEVHSLNTSIESAELSLRNLNNDISTLKKEYARIAWYAYQYKTSYNKLIFLFSSESINQAYQRMRYLDQLGSYIRQQASEIKQLEAEKKNNVQVLSAKREKLTSLLQKENEEVYALENELKQKKQVTTSLGGQESQLKKTLKDKQQEANKLAQQIEQIIAAETKPVAKPGKPATYQLTPEERVLSNSFFANKGKLPWPVERGVITETFGLHKHPVLKRVQTKNNGVDFATSKDSDARCVFDGVVTSVTKISNTNIAIIVKHGDYFTVYSNLDLVFVQKGERVNTLQLLGRIHTNLKGETELHFEVRKGAVPQNPAYWIAK